MSASQTAVTSRACRCGSMIKMVPWANDINILIPVDVDKDPKGDLVIVGRNGRFTVRLVVAGETPAEGLRRRAHWGVCPHRQDWHGAMSSVGLLAVDRSGPCAACHQRHPYRYGGPIASPLCDTCRAEKGLPPLQPKNHESGETP